MNHLINMRNTEVAEGEVINKNFVTILLFALVLTCYPYADAAHALTNTDLMGEYSLVSGYRNYSLYGIITEKDLSYFKGRASFSGQGVVFEMSFYYKGVYFSDYACGFYTLTGNQVTATLVGYPVETVNVNISGDILTASGSGYDENGYYTYSYKLQKNQTYYTKTQLDLAVSTATAQKDALISEKDQAIQNLNSTIQVMYSKDQLDQAVATAMAQKDAIIAQKDQDIQNLNSTIQAMYSKTQLDQAVATATAQKDILIAQKDKTILALSDLNGDNVLTLQDIVWGLRVLSAN